MRYSRLIAFFFAVAIFGMFAASGQTPGSSTSEAAGAAETQTPQQAPTAQIPQQDLSPNMQPPAEPNFAPTWSRFEIQVKRLPLKHLADRPLDPQVDPGIRLRAAGGPKMCGSITSYNFSPGDNPQLQSITTCTPSQGVRTLRTHDEYEKPEAPLLQKTNYSPSPKQ